MEIKLERITPTRAQKYLDANKGNRKLREGVVEKYEEDMKAGNWTECPVPITIYKNGDIADGQHRLWAIVESGITQDFFVCRGLAKEAGLNLDTGLGRSIVDNARISGLDPDMTNELVALAQFYHHGVRQWKAVSNAKRLEILNLYREPLMFATSTGIRGKGVRNSVTLAALARAYVHGEDPERIREFANVLSTGMSENGTQDFAAIALRNYIVSKERKVVGHNGRDYFLKVQNALHHFMKRKPVNVIRTVKDEMYPLPKKKK